MIITEYTDARGLKHKVQLEKAGQQPELGIHLSLNLEDFLRPYGIPIEDIVAIQQILWQNEIVFARDYFGAVFDKVVSAFRTKLPPDKAKIIGNALINDVREVTNANRNTRQYDHPTR